ncbi:MULTISPECIES: RNase E specificity factor CsrD [Cedecea]|uniref:Diguanylate cyclase domain protein n=1 Tax=Cedecea davisae DSM 4568 TaxID=566551 RepID=S3IND0_9ENTR|nr:MULTISPECIES: RNase E specificity factor CsrD [Cedecea]EPF14031.1 diguanylate cyclase domain protein [Cedecea davisae DSM 4568]QIX96159.1 RNase E specificity factor CsrD [Cedecea sp. FDAARGOS_727]SUX37494.1 Regulator of CsrB and CsrC decay CsrD [Cedecea davisae]
MRLTTKLSAFITLLTGLAIIVTLLGCLLSFYSSVHDKTQQRIMAVATIIDNQLVSSSPQQLASRFTELMTPVDITGIRLQADKTYEFQHVLPEDYRPTGTQYLYRTLTVDLMKHPGMTLTLTYRDPVALYYHAMFTTTPLTAAIAFMLVVLLLAGRWLKKQLSGQELLEARAGKIISGERGVGVRGSVHEWPPLVSSAIDALLSDLQSADEQRNRVDTLIRAFAAQDVQTGLNNRLFFDNQLATLLDGQEQVGAHGVVMIVRLPDFELLKETWGNAPVEEYLFTLVNLLSTFVMRYPGALLARYFRSDFAVLLPHRTLKEADGIASQLLNAVDALPPTRMVDRSDMLHIGICAWRSGQTKEQVMEKAEIATRNAAFQGANSWSVYDDKLPEQGRGSVKWRTLLEQVLKQGGPRFYQKPAVDRLGIVHHREIMCRIFDGEQEVLSAEYMPMVRQFGLSEQYDRQVVSRLLPLLSFWPEETLAIQVTVDSLIRAPFQRWLRDSLMQCEKSKRSRIIFELAEADVCQHISRLQPVVRLITALGARIVVIQAGLTVVSTTYIKELDVGLIKLHPGLVRNIGKRTENQLFVNSLVESCKGTRTRVFATGVRTRGEWQTLIDNGVAGAQGDFIAASQPLDSNVKKYSQRYSV